jgi:hypothetical protein
MQFQIPQFIETESKIIGPLSLKQFAYMGIAGFMVFILFYVLETFVWIFFSVIIVGAAFALAFIRFNGQKLPTVIVSVARYFWRPKFFLWKAAHDKIQDDSGISRREEKLLQKPVVAPESAPQAPPAVLKEDLQDTTLKLAIPTEGIEESPAIPPELTQTETPALPEPTPQDTHMMETPVIPEITREPSETLTSPPLRTEATPAETRTSPAALAQQNSSLRRPTQKKPRGGNLKNLWLKLSTATKAIAHREKHPPQAAVQNAQAPGKKSEEIFELFRKITGEREVARRVDYR